jgi:hypothetical protein
VNRDSFRVPGEDLPWPVPFAALGVGSACSAAVVALVSGAAAAQLPPPVVMAAPPPLVAPSAMVVVPSGMPAVGGLPAQATSAALPVAPAAPGQCPPLAVVFRYAAETVPSASLPALQRLAVWMKAHPSATALVHGHADAQGNEDKNLALSKQRARNVSLVLAMDGVARDRVTVRGFGTYQPVEGVPEDASANRRVVVLVKGAHECPFAAEEISGP